MQKTGYDPSHPDADWSGFVAPRTSRKHPDGIPTALAVHISLQGPNEDAGTAEWTRPARKVVAASRSEAGSTFFLIGGPVPPEDPSAFDPSKWATEAGASMAGIEQHSKSTHVSRLTDKGRAMHIRGKKTVVPGNHEEGDDGERAKRPQEEGTDQTPFLHNDGQDLTKLAGYRSRQGSKSLLDGLAIDVAKNVENATKCMAVSLSPYATDGNLPTDPYIAADGHRKKDLLLENYSSVIPGYTGKRTFI